MKNKSQNKYFVYGCDELLDELMTITESAAEAELNDYHAAEWLLEEFDIPMSSLITWGDAIRYILKLRLHKIEGPKIMHKTQNDPPF